MQLYISQAQLNQVVMFKGVKFSVRVDDETRAVSEIAFENRTKLHRMSSNAC